MHEITTNRTVFPGQFRLTRLQVVDWGTFCGYKDFPIDERGVLFTGPSGSGKSSLMDGHSVALLPTREQRFNASADLTARGAKQGSRSTADYVRGAWAETDDEHGQAQVRYLRAGRPTWSAVAATYDNGLGDVTTAVVVKWFPGLETDGSALKTMHQLHHGQFDLNLLDEWARHGKGFDTHWFKNAYPATYPDSQDAYMRELAKRVGLGTSKTALSLLGKAKATKNVGDLNLFIRDNMLDEPDTFAAAKKMIEAFNPLNDAYETARRARNQAQTLHDVPGHWATNLASKDLSNLAGGLLGTPMEHYLRGVHLNVLRAEIDRLTANITRLEGQLGRQRQEASDAETVYLSLNDQLRKEGAALTDLQTRHEAAVKQTEAREHAYRIYSGYVTRLGLRCPDDEAGFNAVLAQAPSLQQRAQEDKKKNDPQLNRARAAAGDADRQWESKGRELTVLRAARSLLPPHALERRERIADETRIPLTDLPYAAELIDIADGQERWRPAAEKVLRGFGLRLLVPEHHKDAVREFVDTHDMRGVVEYSVVTGVSAHQPRPDHSTLAGKLTVDMTHPCGPWLAGQLTRKFDHICVETARDLEGHRIAVTVLGTVKLPGNHYRKDDRPELTRPSSYTLGSNTAAKRAALEREVAELETVKTTAATRADQLEEHAQALRSTIDATAQVKQYTEWADLDHWTSRDTARTLADRITELKAGDTNLQRLEAQRDEAKTAWDRRVDSCAVTRTTISTDRDRNAQLTELYETEELKPHTIRDDRELAYLEEVYADLEMVPFPETIGQLSSAFRRELERRRDAADSDRRLAITKIKAAIDAFLKEWPDTAPDTSGDPERSGGAFAALHEEISKRRLPEAMERFQRMISEDMVPSVSFLQRTIEKASTHIRDRVDMVNAGLRKVEFNHGAHLQIAIDPRQFDASKEFRSHVDALLTNAPAARKDPQASIRQFKRVRELMARFTTVSTEADRWRREVLDVRLSYAFYGREQTPDGLTVHTYRNTASNSGGEQEKLVAFCLAAALSYNLADPDSDGRPRFAPLMLDEAFSKSDETFSAQALSAFDEFGFQLLVAAPIRMSGVLEPFIGQAILVEKRLTPDGVRSSAASATFGELAVRRVADFDGGVLASA